jgi:hypothetical protein
MGLYGLGVQTLTDNWDKEKKFKTPHNQHKFLTLIRLFKFLLEVNFHWLLIRVNTFGLSEIVRMAVWDWENDWKINSDQLELKVCPISSGLHFGIVLDDSGSLWSFGYNGDGQLGLGDNTDRWSPCKIEGIPPIVQVSSGYYNNLILDSHRGVLSFGYNGSGQLGHSGTAKKNIPERIPNLVDIVQIFCAGDTSIVKNDSQQFFVFGSNAAHRAEEGEILTLVEQETWRGKIIFPGGSHTVILDEDGFLSFLGSEPRFVLKGKHEVKVNFPKFQASNIKKALPFLGSFPDFV